MDETYIKARGHWKYLYRTVDKAGNTERDTPVRIRRAKYLNNNLAGLG